MEKDPVRESNGKADKQPLYLRLYQNQVYIDVARMVGYAGLSLADAREQMKGLGEKYDKEKLVKAAEELVDIDDKGVRLKANVRKLAFQLLGPPPEMQDAFYRNADGTPKGQPPKPETPKPAAKPAQKPKKAVEPPKVKETPLAKSKSSVPEGGGAIMRQYREAKEKHPGMILLFRIGDFYEVFDEDAETLHKTLGLTLTTRDQVVSMAGFPHHQLEAYLHKLLKAGLRVAICDQVEESLARGPIKREVQRVVTPEDGDSAEEPS